MAADFGQAADGRAVDAAHSDGCWGIRRADRRIGGGLGIGAAVLVGHGVASADTGDTSGSGSSSTSSGSSTGSSGAASTSSSEQPAEEKADTSTDSSETKSIVDPTPKRKKKSTASRQWSRPTHEAAESTGRTGAVTARTVRSDPTEQTKTSDEPKAAEDPAPTASVSVSSVPKTADVIVETPKQQPQARVEAATTAISSMVSTVLNPFAGNSPTAPAESPLPWMVMAAARQELGRTPSLNKAVSPVRTSDDVDPVSNALAATDTAPRVIAIPQTSLLQPLQQLPVVGPLFVTPVVALIHQIPFVGDILHPIIGYPLGLTGGTTPRDVKVISFDGTPIYVHFFPAQGVAKGTPAPTS